MGFLIAIFLLVVSSWGVLGTFQRLRRTHAGRAWWVAFAALTVVGVVAGSWLALRFEYQVSPQMRYVSFPMPLAFFHLEDGHWVDFVTPPHVLYPGLVANILAVIAALLLPLLLASVLLHRRQKDETHMA
ncbi:MAG: hypothetical protein KIT22_08550 [Verrucomicrobiae bacterium]|nr:hypothetical protein [Verrucomicrobiae bacterium]